MMNKLCVDMVLYNSFWGWEKGGGGSSFTIIVYLDRYLQHFLQDQSHYICFQKNSSYHNFYLIILNSNRLTATPHTKSKPGL